MIRRRARFIALLFFTFSLTLTGCFYTFPFQSLALIRQFNLWSHGVTRGMSGQLEVFSRNFCDKPERCQCVLLVHGLGDNATTWSQILNSQKNDWKTPIKFVAVNLPGSGDSPKFSSTDDYRISKIVKLISKDVMSHCKEWNVVGNSFGGWVASRLATDVPHKVKKLLLLSSVGVRADYGHVLPYYFNLTQESIKALSRKTYHYSPLGGYVPDYIYHAKALQMQTLPITEMILAQHKSAGEEYLDKKIGAISIPVGLLWGASDKISRVEVANSFASKLKNLKFKKIVPDCGHLPQSECPESVKVALNEILSL